MLVDALMLAEPYMKISHMIDDPKEYVYLTDAILREIERSRAPELAPCQGVLRRIRERDIYKFVDEYYFSREESPRISKTLEAVRSKADWHVC